MNWCFECQTCKHATYYYGGSFACGKDECEYEPYKTTATTTTYEIDYLHHDTQTKGG